MAVSVIPKPANMSFKIISHTCMCDNKAGMHEYSLPTWNDYGPLGIVGYAATGSYDPSKDVYEISISNNKIRIGWESAHASKYGLIVNILYNALQ